MAEPRHHRLGLGAQPKPPEPTDTNGFGNGKKYIPKPGDQARRAEEELKVRTSKDNIVVLSSLILLYAVKKFACSKHYALTLVNGFAVDNSLVTKVLTVAQTDPVGLLASSHYICQCALCLLVNRVLTFHIYCVLNVLMCRHSGKQKQQQLKQMEAVVVVE
jgi:hypothetical protein